MDGWLKALIAATCALIIAVGGYLASIEYNSKYSTKATNDDLIKRNEQTIRSFDAATGQR
ncbi:hypothetical protein GGE68_002936 [Rhizobium leguminosarum]|uniref:hypothetical protein n=1 Tax=Rhizobium leguminosarum TaxID=384 RepID=UPI00160F0338|nr:hypothetical protein [Rhizobium leguminosarum]MBB5664739.1 hypothetical protein [Rhizobium leguminosarum]